MKIVISIQSLWACKILNGEKSIEVRKGLALYNALKKAEERGEEVEFLMYVTKDKPLIRLESLLGRKIKYDVDLKRNRNAYSETLDGKVVARFKAKAEIIKENHNVPEAYYNGERDFTLYDTYDMDDYELLKESCLSDEQMFSYLHDDKTIASKGTALHIKDLEIFDKPKTLADYGLKRAPQSWCYAKEGEANG